MSELHSTPDLRLRMQVFHGTPDKVEQEINQWFDSLDGSSMASLDDYKLTFLPQREGQAQIAVTFMYHELKDQP